jgi:hypothetical protein
MTSLAFTTGFGNAGRLYERLRKRSLRAIDKKKVADFIKGRATTMGGTDTYMEMDHQAYVKGLYDGIKGALNLAKTGDLY